MNTIFDEIASRLDDAGIDDPRREARALILAVEGQDPLLHDIYLSDELEKAIELRCQRVPLSKIIGLREFYGRDFIVDENVLDPRPDSETLIEAALPFINSSTRVLDMGTGSGCLLLTLLAEKPGATGVGVDISDKALVVAKLNARHLNLVPYAELVLSDFERFEAPEKFDVMISNPPYIPSREIDTLAPEVKLYDPILALDGGSDGCDPYKTLLRRLPEILLPGGHFFLELSPDICENIVQLAIAAGHQEIEVISDLAGRARVLKARCG